jgi:uncharacterized protein (DUF58 family)
MQTIVNFWKDLYLPRRFFVALGAIIFLFLVAFAVKPLFFGAQAALIGLIAAVVVDCLLLFRQKIAISAIREVPRLLSNGDANRIKLVLTNHSNVNLQLNIIDELPAQLRIRNFELRLALAANTAKELDYDITPNERGVYEFGVLNVFATSPIGLVERRFKAAAAQTTAVYPSVIQMRQFELRANKQIAHQSGIKKIRRLGHSYEFEQIKNYVAGDDFRTLNWKASSRRASLMVNQYEDERSQQVYCILDKSRVMDMPFNNLTLLDHAINTSLVISNIILQRKDKVGLFSFSDKLGATLAADNSSNQLQKILHELYHEQPGMGEASYELLYYAVRKLIRGRSLLMLFTNFESTLALDRVLPTLRLLNKQHLLLVVFFKNTDIEDFAQTDAQTVSDIYDQTIARKYISEKMQMMQKLRQHGIQTILTRPEDLSINTVNKYLEFKSRGLI